MTDVHYASLTSQGVQHRVFYLDGHTSRYQPRPTGLNFGEQTGTGVFPLVIAVPLFYISFFNHVFREDAVHGSLPQLMPSEINAGKVKLCKFQNRQHVKFSPPVDQDQEQRVAYENIWHCNMTTKITFDECQENSNFPTSK